MTEASIILLIGIPGEKESPGFSDRTLLSRLTLLRTILAVSTRKFEDNAHFN